MSITELCIMHRINQSNKRSIKRLRARRHL